MQECKTDNMTGETGSTENSEQSPEMVRREFIKRFGVYAAGSALGLYVLMSAKTARAIGSDGAP